MFSFPLYPLLLPHPIDPLLQFPERFRSRGRNVHSIPRLNTDVAIVRETVLTHSLKFLRYVPAAVVVATAAAAALSLSFLVVVPALSPSPFAVRVSALSSGVRTRPGTFSACNGISSGYRTMRRITFCRAQ